MGEEIEKKPEPFFKKIMTDMSFEKLIIGLVKIFVLIMVLRMAFKIIFM